jgi:hypothetical protein
MMQFVLDQEDQDRMRRFADECDHRAVVLERQIKAPRYDHRSKGRTGT